MYLGQGWSQKKILGWANCEKKKKKKEKKKRKEILDWAIA
jgi:hypothetical protein